MWKGVEFVHHPGRPDKVLVCTTLHLNCGSSLEMSLPFESFNLYCGALMVLCVKLPLRRDRLRDWKGVRDAALVNSFH